MSTRKGSLLALRDRVHVEPPVTQKGQAAAPATSQEGAGGPAATELPGKSPPTPPSRQGKKAMTGYFTPEMSFAMNVTARKHDMSLQDAMAEAFNDWLRKMGESPVGE